MNPDTPISHIMTTDLVTVESDTRLHKIRQIFEQYKFHHLPVLEYGKLVGIISKSDFYRLHFASNHKASNGQNEADVHRETARDLMTQFPMHLDSDDTIGLAADIFLANRFHALPVVDGGELVGIVTSHDLISYAFGYPVLDGTLVEDFSDI